MNTLWLTFTILKFGGVGVAVLGVGIFGYFFVRENARSARSSQNVIPMASWRGKGPIVGTMILAAGILAQLAAYLIAITSLGRL